MTKQKGNNNELNPQENTYIAPHMRHKHRKRLSQEEAEKKRGEPIVKQEFRDEVNINTIAERAKMGLPVRGPSQRPLYGDLPNPKTYSQAVQKIQNLTELMAAQPAKVRERFGNDPQQLLNFVMDKRNTREAVALGLIDAPLEEPAPSKAKAPPVEGGKEGEA